MEVTLIQFADGRTLLRHGECDGCNRPGLTPGACCSFISLPLSRPYNEDERAWAEMHQGLSFIDNQTIKVESRCSALTDEGKCALYGLPSRPVMCQNAPEVPEQLIPGCAYTFTEVHP